jgi:hypothetical protein
LILDAGYVGEDQIKYFSQLMTRIRVVLTLSRYEKLTKIALLHHHVSHLWDQQLELKKFEATIDAHALKQALLTYGFDFVLHGHKHTNHVGLDASLIPLAEDKQRKLKPLCIVAGGAIGGQPRQGHKQTFKLISFREDRGPRTPASVKEVSISSLEEAIEYNIPVLSRVAELNNWKTREKFKVYLREQLAAEPKPFQDGLVVTEGRLPPGNPLLVTEGVPFDMLVDRQGKKVFYTSLLAARELTLEQRARIYWFVAEIKAHADTIRSGDSEPFRGVVLVANFEETRFFEGLQRGEVKASIEKLRQSCEPAIKSGRLEIRVHTFTHDQAESIAT